MVLLSKPLNFAQRNGGESESWMRESKVSVA